MRLERTIASKVEESLWPATPAQSGIPVPLMFMPEDRVRRTMVRMVDGCTCVDSRHRTLEGNGSVIILLGGGVFESARHGHGQEGK